MSKVMEQFKEDLAGATKIGIVVQYGYLEIHHKEMAEYLYDEGYRKMVTCGRCRYLTEQYSTGDKNRRWCGQKRAWKKDTDFCDGGKYCVGDI